MLAALSIALAIGLSGAPPEAAPLSVPPAALAPPPETETPAAEPPEPEAPEWPDQAETETPRHRHVASWVLLGTGAAALLCGGALNLAAATAAPGGPVALATGVPATNPQANGLWTGAIVSYSVGAALGLAGAIAYYLEGRR